MCKKRELSLPSPSNEDEAVSRERRKVLSGDTNGELLLLQNLTKVYGNFITSKKRLAVNQLCLAVKKGEVRVKFFIR